MSGLEIFMSDGQLQASSEVMTFHCRKAGVQNTQSKVFGNTTPSSLLISMAGCSDYALCAVLGDGGQTASLLSMTTLSGQRYWNFATTASIGSQFHYWIFDRAGLLPASNFGLEITDSAGTITFSSNYYPMVVTDVLTGYGDSVTHSGRMLGFFNGAWAGYRVSDNIAYYSSGQQVPEGDPWDERSWRNDGELYGGRGSGGAVTVTVDTVPWDVVTNQPTSADIPPDFAVQPNLFVVDVTGIPAGTFF